MRGQHSAWWKPTTGVGRHAVQRRYAVRGSHQPVQHLQFEVGHDLVDQFLRLHPDELAVVLAHVLLVPVPVVVLLPHRNRVVRQEHVAVVAITLAHGVEFDGELGVEVR